jgi:hypothetical protein
MLERVFSRAHLRPLAALGALAAVLVLGGCGVTITSNSPASGSSSTAQTATAAASQGTGTPSAGGCPGGMQSVQWPATPTVIVTNVEHTPVTLTVGQTLEVREPTGHTYVLEPTAYSPALQLDSPAGYEDQTLNACVWHFTAVQAGTARIVMVMGPYCPTHTKCPQYVTAPVTLVTVTVR